MCCMLSETLCGNVMYVPILLAWSGIFAESWVIFGEGDGISSPALGVIWACIFLAWGSGAKRLAGSSACFADFHMLTCAAVV